MLILKDIVKDYTAGDTTVRALKGVSINFRESELVSILGPSGCGKTTMLNIIGGLDRYTSGDLMINGKSTKEFTDGDWDTYRNHSIGFVFQSYNLIPHQTVLANVELALTLSGVSKKERRERAAEALRKVGLGEQLNKRPSQMSGGQMQRVAIARAIVNNPDIILADEPTGALDSETSVQIMEILKEIAQDKLIIMVTHNPELAKRYSTRIISVLDGEITDDTDPFTPTEADFEGEKEKSAEEKKKGKSPPCPPPRRSPSAFATLPPKSPYLPYRLRGQHRYYRNSTRSGAFKRYRKIHRQGAERPFACVPRYGRAAGDRHEQCSQLPYGPRQVHHGNRTRPR